MGDPVSDGPEFKPDASNTAAEQALQWGMHNDGLVYFPLDRGRGHGNNASDHGLLVQNHEYTDDGLLFPDGNANWTAQKTLKSQNAHGVGVIEIKRTRRPWTRWQGRGRRVAGRAAVCLCAPHHRPDPHEDGRAGCTVGDETGDPRLITSADPTGRRVLGTINNCAMGFTPWGTYLACEENFNGYFRKTEAQTPLEQRYGINASGAGYLWHTTDLRFNADLEPNEANRFGWVVEFDPFDPRSTPVKRSALGRLKHEGAWVQEARDGRVVVYMGDDEQFEYIYRYVSNQRWRRAIAHGVDPLDDGILYVAKFHDDGTGEWIALTPDNPALTGWSLNDILINTRGAADAAGATPMDRPEWIDTFPDDLAAVATLTNNANRGVAGTNPRTGEPNSPVDSPIPGVVPHPARHPQATRTGTSSAGSTARTSRSRRSTGTSSLSVAIRTTPATAPARTSTSSGRRTASTSRRAAGCGSRPTSRRVRSTPGTTPGSGTTRCSAPIRRPVPSGDSSSAQGPAK